MVKDCYRLGCSLWIDTRLTLAALEIGAMYHWIDPQARLTRRAEILTNSTGIHTRFYHRYHVVWVTKSRHKLLCGPMRERIRDILRQVCEELGVHIEKGVLSTDHVHMLLSIPPHIALSKVMRRMKGRSSFKTGREAPELRKRYWVQRLWARGYFFDTFGHCDRRCETSVFGIAVKTTPYRRQPVVIWLVIYPAAMQALIHFSSVKRLQAWPTAFQRVL